MEIKCAAIECAGAYHNMTPTEMILVIHSFQTGELLKIGGTPAQVHPRCLEEAFTPENIAYIKRQYPRRDIREPAA